MKTLILSACTGNGHIAVMNSINSYIDRNLSDVELFPAFYEELMPSNKVLSNFYNLLQTCSFEMCKLYTQMSILKSEEDLQNTYYYWQDPLDKFVNKHACDIIISTTPLINPEFPSLSGSTSSK